MPPYTELQVTSNFSFLRGASHPEELFACARELGYRALGITDRGSFAGLVRAHLAAREHGVRLVVGCRLDLEGGAALLVYPTDRAAYGRLCRLLTLGKRRAGKGACRLDWKDVEAASEGQIGVLVSGVAGKPGPEHLARLRAAFPARAYLALTRRYRPGEARRLHRLAAQADRAGLPTVATGDVLYHHPERCALADVLSALRHRTTVDALGFRAERNAERALKAPEEMARLFAAYPEAVAHTRTIADSCRFGLDELRYQYPEETPIPGLGPQEALERLAAEGAKWRYPAGVPERVVSLLAHELRLIGELGFAPYFLTVHAIVQAARAREILCQGRGSAANSAVCFVLGITAIDPTRHDLLFERFVSAARGEPPDIDVDFEHDRREEVIQWIYETYGRERAALAAVVIRYRTRGAIRDAGKAFGLSADAIAALSREVSGWSREGLSESALAALGFDRADRRLRLVIAAAQALVGFPRHLSQHPGGFVLTRDRLDELVPVEPAAMADRQVIEWDKDDIDALGMMKVDVLGLGMLGCLTRGFALLREHRGLDLDLARIPPEDPATYAMIRAADTVGVFQIESRAQMAMLPRLKPRSFYDLVIEVAIVRPGPIQGDMVHPYLRRRAGREPVSFPSPDLESVLGKTLGVPLFQEQAMRVAIHCAGFSAAEADRLRQAMATFKHTGGVGHFRDKLIAGMVARGYAEEFAHRTFRQIEGFGSYGFPESHAASFALLVYGSAWLKRHHPEVFAAALLNSQPMGFYAPAQILRDAAHHGVEIRPLDVNRSRWDCTLEEGAGGRLALRIGLRLARGLSNREAAALVAARGTEPYASPADAQRRAGVAAAALERIAEADGFASLGLRRRQALWAVRGLQAGDLPLFAAAEARTDAPATEPAVALPALSAGADVVADYASLGFSLRCHPLAFLRAELAARGMVTAAGLATLRDGARVILAGLVLMRQRPGSARGVLFATIEDESGQANLIVWPDLFERERRAIVGARLLACRGRLQREGIVLHVICDHVADLSDLLDGIGAKALEPVLSRADETKHPAPKGEGGLRVRARDFR